MRLKKGEEGNKIENMCMLQGFQNLRLFGEHFFRISKLVEKNIRAGKENNRKTNECLKIFQRLMIKYHKSFL